jgi:hypothetical protein
MTLTWKAIGDDIILQEGTSAYNYQAGSTIKAGMALSVKESPMIVSGCKAKDSTNFVGIAAYDTSHDKYVAVYGPGNIVRCRVSGAVTTGDALQTASDTEIGYLAKRTVVAGAKVAIALETVAADTTNGTVCRILVD